MKFLLAAVLLFLGWLPGRSQTIETAFAKIKIAAYKDYTIKDTLIHRDTYNVFTAIDPEESYTKTVTVLEKIEGEKKSHYKLSADAHFENDSTVIFYGPALKTPPSKTGFPAGLWFYSSTTVEKHRFKPTGSETNFTVDSLPPKAKSLTLPTEPGIYMYINDNLSRVSPDQTFPAFEKAMKNGFYFLPNPGLFYLRFDVRSFK